MLFEFSMLFKSPFLVGNFYNSCKWIFLYVKSSILAYNLKVAACDANTYSIYKIDRILKCIFYDK